MSLDRFLKILKVLPFLTDIFLTFVIGDLFKLRFIMADNILVFIRGVDKFIFCQPLDGEGSKSG